MHKYYAAIAIIYILIFVMATTGIKYYWLYLVIAGIYGAASYHEYAMKHKHDEHLKITHDEHKLI